MTLAQAQAYALEMARIELHVNAGESGVIWLMRQIAATGGFAPLLPVEAEWCYSERDFEGARLPDGVQYELRVAEGRLSDAQTRLGVAWKHGARQFQVLRPSPLPPAGDVRFWRFYLSLAETDPAEEVIAN